MSKRIVIVGASSGLGKEIALIFLEKGWKVGIASRNIESLKEIEKLYPQSAVSQHKFLSCLSIFCFAVDTLQYKYFFIL